jgi:Kinesin motor domain
MVIDLGDKKNANSVRYEDCVLTSLLKSTFEGDSYLVLLCHVSKELQDYEATVSNLIFAKRFKKIPQNCIKNQVPHNKMHLIRIQNQINAIKGTLMDIQTKNIVLAEKNQILIEKDKKNNALDLEIKQSSLELQKNEKLIIENINKIEKLQSKILVPENLNLPFALKPLRSEKDCIERRILKYSIARSSGESKDENFFINILKASRGHSITKSHQKFDSLNSISFESDSQLMDFSKLHRPKESIAQESYTKDSMLLEKIESINQLFDGINNKPGLVEEQDRIIDSLQQKLIDKNNQIELLQDELDLCRNNLFNMQQQLKKLKKKGDLEVI